MALFNDETMIEILRVRERLTALKNKAQPYPELEQPEKETLQDNQWTNRQWAKVQQFEGRVIHLENKVVGLTAKRKEDTKYIYSNIKEEASE